MAWSCPLELLDPSAPAGELEIGTLSEEAHPDAKKMHKLSTRERIVVIRFVFFMELPFVRWLYTAASFAA
jgi:hypothetical protein